MPTRAIAHAALLMTAAACTGSPTKTAVEPALPPPAPSAPKVAASASAAPPMPAVEEKPPCERAAEWLSRVPGLRASGKLDRAHRALSRAAEVCPERAAEARAMDREVAAELGIDARKVELSLPPKVVQEATEHFNQAGAAWLKKDWDAAIRGALAAREAASPFPEALTLAARATLAKGDQAAAQRLFDRAIVDAIRYEAARGEGRTGAPLELLPPQNDFSHITTLPGPHPLLGVTTTRSSGMVIDLENRSTTRIGLGRASLPMLAGDGTRIYVLTPSSIDPNSLLIYDRATAQLVRIFHVTNGQVSLSAISPDEKRAGFVGNGAGRAKARIETMDLMTGRSLGVSNLDNPLGIASSPDSKFFAITNVIQGNIGDEFDWIKLFDAATARPLRRLVPKDADERCVPPMAISSNGTIASMVMGSLPRPRLRLFDAQTGKERTECNVPERPRLDVEKIVASPDGSAFVALLDEHGRASHLRVWESSTCKEHPPLADDDHIEDFGFLNDKHIATLGGRQIRILDRSTGQQKGTVQESVSVANTVTFSSDGKQLAWGLHDGAVFLWNPSASTTPKRIAAHTHEGAVSGVAFVLGGKALAAARGSVIDLWSTDTGQPIRTLSGHGDEVNDIVASSDGKLLVSVSDDETARIWDAATGRLMQTLQGHKAPIDSAAFSPDTTLVATGSREGKIVVRSAKTGQIVREMGKGAAHVYGLAFMGTESLWAWTTDRILRRWDVGTGAMLVEQAKGTGSGFATIALSPDGKQIAATGLVGLDVGLFDTRSAEPVRTLKRSAFASTHVFDVAISPDGNLLAGVAGDGSLYLWRMSSDKPIVAIRASEGHDAAIAFTEDGYVDFMGADSERLRRLTLCGVEARWFPFDACAERLHVPGLFAKVWKDDTRFREP